MVQIDRIEVLGYTWPHLELEIDCSKGTYIRSIARDVGEALGCGGYVQELVRTRIGPFTLGATDRPARALGGFDRPAVPPAARGGRPPEAVRSRRRPDRGGDARPNDRRCRKTWARTDPKGLVALVDRDSRLVALAEPDATESSSAAESAVLTR